MAASSAGKGVFNALVRTHHITSRKKVGKLKEVASREGIWVLLRSGSSPGIMYVEGPQTGVENWLASVQRLRYKDFHLAVRPAEAQREHEMTGAQEPTGFDETASMKDFAQRMDGRGVLTWWRNGMGYAGNEDRL